MARAPRVVIFLLLAALVLLGASLQGDANTMLAASVQTEVIEIQVVNPAAATIALPRARLAEQNQCFENVLIRPAAKTKLQYSRTRHGPLVLVVDGKAEWTHGAPDSPRLSASSLEFDVRDAPEPPCCPGAAKPEPPPCNAGPRVRLPVNGTVTIGSDLPEVRDARDRQLALLGGKLLLYGRAVGDLFGLPLRFGPLEPGALYFSQDFPLPGGSRIASARLESQAGDERGAENSRWYGFADISFAEGDHGAITVEASTNARFVELYTPAPYRSASGGDAYRPDTISLSLGARLTGDPNLLWIYGLVAVFATLLGLSEYLQKTKE
jgi:hypothetical protein